MARHELLVREGGAEVGVVLPDLPQGPLAGVIGDGIVGPLATMAGGQTGRPLLPVAADQALNLADGPVKPPGRLPLVTARQRPPPE